MPRKLISLSALGIVLGGLLAVAAPAAPAAAGGGCTCINAGPPGNYACNGDRWCVPGDGTCFVECIE